MISRSMWAGLALVVGSSLSASADVLRVDSSALPSGDGLSWSTAFDSLQNALAQSEAGDELWLAEGFYRPDSGLGFVSGDRAATFELPSGVALFGGFIGTEFESESRLGLATKTVLSGDLLGNDTELIESRFDNSLHVVTATGVSNSTLLDGITIASGNADGSGEDSQGGALYFKLGSEPQLRECILRANVASLDGGALLNTGNSNPRFEDCHFEENVSGRNGGAVISTTDCVPVFLRCTFEANTAEQWGGATANTGASLPSYVECEFRSNFAVDSGGAQWTDNASILIENCIYRDNQAVNFGGAIFASGSPTIRDGIFIANEATSGGAMYLHALFSFPVLENCSFTENTSHVYGGAIFSSANPTLTSCKFSRNITSGTGGAVRTSAFGKECLFTDCEFVENEAFRGGGASNIGTGLSRYERCRFRSNRASEWGGALYHGEALLEVVDSEFVQNEALAKGGGVFLNNLVAGGTIADTVFRHCRAQSVGGGLYVTNSSSPSVTDCRFFSNFAAAGGGGAYNASNEGAGGVSNGRYERCVFESNVTFGDGGAFFNGTSINGGEANPVLVDCTFANNRAVKDGGALYNIAFRGTSAPTLIGNEFYSNRSDRDGGAVFNTSNPNFGNSFCDATLTNCVFSGNFARRFGGAVYNESRAPQPASSNLSLLGCVLSANEALAAGGGLYNSEFGSGIANPLIRNSILWQNLDAGGHDESAQFHIQAGNLALEFSCIENWNGLGDGCTSINPRFLDADGEDGITGTCDDNLRLRTASFVIDAGRNSIFPQDIADLDRDLNSSERSPHDFDRQPRFADFSTADTGFGVAPIVDMGAFEARDCDGNGINDAEDVFLGALDCNGNHVPDICELAPASGGICTSGCGGDSDGDGVLDECEASRPVGSGGSTGERELGERRPKKKRRKAQYCLDRPAPRKP